MMGVGGTSTDHSRQHGAPIFRRLEVQIDELVDGGAMEKPENLDDRERDNPNRGRLKG
jgi:hypothetical protein